ncbi:OadG family protein [Enterococcus sp. AZ109]|uniref:OadG family protein n=1 Tax=Enterococcus sp. AZ109 TaxID=2774634 RepID=UPI003F2664C8
MEHTLTDSLSLTIVAMSIVFLLLTGLMVLMELTAKFVKKIEKQPAEKLATTTKVSSNLTATAELERVAMLCALAKASEDESGKHYQIEKIQRVR